MACHELQERLIIRRGVEATSHLWSKFQSEVQPQCRVEPQHAQDVAGILRIVRKHECSFAVLGGGTSPFSGASNADGGVTIDLRKLRTLEVFTEGIPRAVVAAGNLWADVYKALDSRGLSATGTRNSLTGVVGSILGGGISFVSEHHGWACDTVIEFEVVLANSSIVRVSEDAHPFLYWALKGGGNNFGIVTSVTLEIYHGPPTWYSFQRFAANDVDLVFDRLERHTAAMSKDVCQIAVTLEWHVASVQFVISERVVAYQVPELPEALIRTCGNGTAEESAVLQTDSYQRSILAMAQKMDAMNKYGYYNFFGSVTVKNDAYVSLLLASTFMEHVAYIRGAEGLQVYIVYNPLTCNTLRHMQKRGGNALGLSPEDGPLTIVNINLHWSSAHDNARMRQFMRTLISSFRQAAANVGMLHPYVFQNHAFEESDVFAGQGVANVRRLRDIRKAVDPDGIFQRLQPGFFKLEAQFALESEQGFSARDEL